jgi:D-alanyl-D-alanine carboxypeptidase
VFVPVPVENPGGGRIEDKTPPDPADIVTVDGLERPIPLHRLAAEAWAALTAAARADGHAAPLLLPVSGHRTVDEQTWLWEAALIKYGGDPEVASLWVARPGTSAHQSGRAIDLHLGDPIESEYVEAMRSYPIHRWLVDHATGFGFYPYDVEPWHWEYNPPSP